MLDGKTLFKEHLYSMAAYEPPLEGRSASKHLLLDFNERTIPVSEHVVEALCGYIRSGSLQKYPSYGDITDKLANYVGAEPENLMITNGSDQGIDLVLRAALSEGQEAVIPEPTFAMYRQVAEVEKAKILSPRYTKDKGYPVDEVINSLTSATKVVVVPMPNNPCGTLVPVDDVERILCAAPDAVVLVDECYYEYSQVSVKDLVAKYSNLVITRTFSKTWGLPSLRFGFLISQSENISQLLKIRGPYDINQLAIVAAEAALDAPEYTAEYVDEVMHVSKPLLEKWLEKRNIDYWPSSANYVWMFPESAADLAAHLAENNILIRSKKNDDGKLGLRVTLGSSEQTAKLLVVLDIFYETKHSIL